MKRLTGMTITALLIVLMQTQLSTAQTLGEIYTNENNVALDGYDVVNYFTANEAARGSATFSATHQGTTFYFTSQEHKDMFTAYPDKYLPQYGGWCAYAVAEMSSKVPTDPETFKLYNGGLYLFFNDYFEGEPTNTIVPWNAKESDMKKKADKNWPTMKQ